MILGFPETEFVDIAQFDGGETGHFSIPDYLKPPKYVSIYTYQ